MEGCAKCSIAATKCSLCIVDPHRSTNPNSCACNTGYIYSSA